MNKKQKEHELEIHQLKEMRKKECERGAEMREELEKKASELQKHQNKEKELQNELRMLREERTTAENETLRNHTKQIEQLEAKARSVCAEMRTELEK